MSFSGIVFDFDHTLASLQSKDFIFSPQAVFVFIRMMKLCDRNRGFRQIDLSQNIRTLFGEDNFTRFTNYSCQLYRPKHIQPIALQIIQACDTYQIPRAVLSDHPCLQKLRAIGLEKGWSCVLNSQTYGALKPLPESLKPPSGPYKPPPQKGHGKN